jgi:hypothetical protein
MRKHHLLLAYIFMIIFSLPSITMDGSVTVDGAPREHHGIRGKLKSLFTPHHREAPPPPPSKHEDTRPAAPRTNVVSPALGAHLQGMQDGVDRRKQEASFYSETFAGSEKAATVKIEERGPMGVPHALTDYAVSVCTIKDQAFLAYIAKEGGVQVVQTKDFLHWTKPVNIFVDAVKDVTYLNCFTFQDHPYVTCGNLLTHSKDGKTWEEPTALPFGDALFVTMIAEKDTLVAALTAKDHCVHLSTSNDTLNWKPIKKVDGWQTQLPVCLVAATQNDSQIGWVANDGSVFTATVCSDLDTYSWGQWAKRTKGLETPAKTQHSISMCKHGNNIWIVFVDERKNIYFTAEDGSKWSAPSPLEKIKTDRPISIFVHTFYKPEYDDKLFVAYKGIDGQVYIKSRFSF